MLANAINLDARPWRAANELCCKRGVPYELLTCKSTPLDPSRQRWLTLRLMLVVWRQSMQGTEQSTVIGPKCYLSYCSRDCCWEAPWCRRWRRGSTAWWVRSCCVGKKGAILIVLWKEECRSS